MTTRVRRRLRSLFIILAILAIAQLGWWSYLLIDQQNTISELIHSIDALEKEKRFIFMVLAEGSFWLVMWSMGLFWIYRTILQERKLYLAQRDFLSAVTHELKTPIANIQLCLEGMNREGITDEQKSKFIQRALSSTEKLHHEIGNILMLNQQTSYQPKNSESIIIKDLVEQCISQIDKDTYSGIKWDVDLSEDLIWDSEKESLTVILKSLLENAAKYSVARRKSTDGDFTPEVEIYRDGSKLIIKDNGIGFSELKPDELFIEFYRGKIAKKLAVPGTGVGLSIAKQVANRININLQLQSEGRNKGCKAILEFKHEQS
jgi:signal transduction histidine kinase